MGSFGGCFLYHVKMFDPNMKDQAFAPLIVSKTLYESFESRLFIQAQATQISNLPHSALITVYLLHQWHKPAM